MTGCGRSEQVHCEQCLHHTKDGVTTYYHSALAGTLVQLGNPVVLPVALVTIYSQIIRCWWVNGVELRDAKEPLLENYLSLSIGNEELKKQTYCNTWITDATITGDTAFHLAACGRARWKIENEHTNVLKNHGYNLKHTFGHGKTYASEMYCVLNLLAFQMHSVLDVSDEDYQQARSRSGRRDEFFNELRFLMRYKLFDCWEQFLIFFSNPAAG